MVDFDFKSLLLLLLALTNSSHAADDCNQGLPSWNVADMDNCIGFLVGMKNEAVYDFTTWSEADISTIFGIKKSFRNGFNLVGSNIQNFDFETKIVSEKAKTITIANNDQLKHMDLEILEGGTPPLLQIHGNKLLDLNSLLPLRKSVVDNDSYIQGDNECDLGNVTLKDHTDLQGCKSVYGNLVGDAQTKWDQMPKLEYVQGCLQIEGTQFSKWTDFGFLQGTFTKGGCPDQHRLTNNPNLCLFPEEVYNLRQTFKKIELTGNKPCIGECTSSHYIGRRDRSCKIVVDTLIITNLTEADNLLFLDSVEEVKGTLKVVATGIVDLKLPNLKILNSRKLARDRLIELVNNRDLKTLELPRLTNATMHKGSDKQLVYFSINNGDFKLSNATMAQLGIEEDGMIIHVVKTTPPTTTTTTTSTTTPPPTPAAVVVATTRMTITEQITTDILMLIVVPLICIFVVGGLVVAVVLFWKKIVRWPSKWQMTPMGGFKFYRPGPIVDFRALTHIVIAAKMLAANRDKIATLDKKHEENSQADGKVLTFRNCEAPVIAATEQQYQDFKVNKRTVLNSPEDTLALPVGKDGVYGQRFMDMVGMPEDVQYGTQCDAVVAQLCSMGVQPLIVDSFATTAAVMTRVSGEMISEKLRFLKETKKEIPAFGLDFLKFEAKPLSKVKVESRLSREIEDDVNFAAHWPEFKIFRYKAEKNKLGECEMLSRFNFYYAKNGMDYVERTVRYLLNLPVGQRAKLSCTDITHFLKVINPRTFGSAAGLKPHNLKTFSGEYAVQMSKSHVRIVGELRGDFDALRKILSIPSNIKGKEHPGMQYNYVFLGNYASGHPLSVETLLTLLGLQFLWGTETIVLLRGALEYEEMNAHYGFKEMLLDRFAERDGLLVWDLFNRAFATFPLNCQVLYRLYCTHGGLSETDLSQNYLHSEEKGTQECTPDSTGHTKVFSLPNVTVKDYYENVDSRAGYYFGERIMQKIGLQHEMYTFFMTTPTKPGLGFFGDHYRCRLFALNSVRNLQGHGGQEAKLAVVAEANAETGRITFNVILDEDETFVQNEDEGYPVAPPAGESKGGKTGSKG